MRGRRVAVSIVFLLALAGCGSAHNPAMPPVVGHKLDIALSDIERAGIKDDVEVVGGGVFGVVDKSNWTVCEQLPEAGQAAATSPRLTVDRSCGEGDPKATESSLTASGKPSVQPSEKTEVPPTPTETPTPKPLTAKTSKDFAAILRLTDTCSDKIAKFADRHSGAAIAFDGSIVAMNPHGSAKTRYDILINAGDYSETVSIPGPNFQFRDVNFYDVNLTGPNVPDSIGLGDNLRVLAQVDKYESNSCLFLLEPLSTEIR